MPRASFNGVVLAESDDTIVMEGNHYFPPESIARQFFLPSDHTTICPWKGEASYYHVEANGELNTNAAWFYPDPTPAAARIKGRIAFWNGVIVES